MPWSWPWSRSESSASTAVAPRAASLLTERAGRSHVRGLPYVLPKDDTEMNRLDFQHYMLRYALRGNYAAPIAANGAPKAILDVGSGTGRWAREMAMTFPDANVIGLDILEPRRHSRRGGAWPRRSPAKL